MNRPYAAGAWEQYKEEIDGIGFSARSHHSTEELARRAAIRLAKSFAQPTGGALSESVERARRMTTAASDLAAASMSVEGG